MAKRTQSHYRKPTVAKKCKADLEHLEEKCSTTILGLNDDCLEAVFSYLSQNDLINVRDSNSKFRLACEGAFARKYARTETIVSNIQGYRVNVKVLKSSVKLVQSFGHIITKLVIEFKMEKVATLLEAIEKHCGDNIKELELRHIGIRVKMPSYPSQIGLEAMDSLLLKINDKFPNLKCIRFDHQNLSKSCPYLKSINRHIPSLTSLSLIGPAFPYDDFLGIVQTNGQLESLTIIGEPNASIKTDRSFELTEDFVQLLDESLPQLKHLKITKVAADEIKALTELPRRFENLKSLEFHSFMVREREYLWFFGENVHDVKLSNFDVNAVTFAQDISRFKQLKRLVLKLNDLMEIEGDMDFSTVLVWSPLGIRKTISVNSQLHELVIERYRTIELFGDTSYEVIEREYLDLVNSKIDGAQWSLKRVENCFTFSKQVQN